MFNSRLPGAKWFLRLAIFLTLPIQNAVSAPQGVVNVALEWGSSAQTFTYVFAGHVTCQNHPCSNARVDLNLDSASQGVITQITRAGEDGRYQFEVTLQGSPDGSSTWKLEAHSSSALNQESAEAEGRVILIEGQTTVVVDRSLLLIQA
jgi:FlaG/FlaF family flagellin (archaellin)